jgi:hypothetical protein
VFRLPMLFNSPPEQFQLYVARWNKFISVVANRLTVQSKMTRPAGFPLKRKRAPSEPGDSSDLEDFTNKRHKPYLGGKPCCHVCNTIIHFLGEHYHQKVPILDTHSNITPCALRPLLPPVVGQKVIEF